jgi:glutathione S-transferase
MKLYTSPLSPYSARVRGSLYYKGLEAEMIKPSAIGGMKSPAFRAVTPIGKIPVLVLDDGFTVIESDSIVEYLEDVFPAPSLRPTNPAERARARMLSRIVELYVMKVVDELIPMMPISLHQAPVPRDEKRIDAGMPQLATALDNLEHFLSKDGPYAAGAELSTADITVACFIPFVHAVELYLQQKGLVDNRPVLAGLVERFPKTSVLQRIFAEVSQAVKDRRAEIIAKFGCG